MMCAARRGEKGVVLIMALLIVALVTTIAVSVSWRFNLSMARNENRWHGSQARAYLEGGEQLARLMLREDAQQGNTDHLGEMWAQPSEPMPTDEGWIRGKVEDAQGRINLNLLQQTAAPGNPGAQGNNPQGAGGNPQALDPNQPSARFNPTQRRFIRLLQTIELEDGPVTQQQAIALVEAIQDWIDPDDQVSGADGAERAHYESEGLEYPIANRPMTTVSELMVVKNMTPELFRKLEPYIIALPPDAQMNINTVPPELLRMFNNKDILEPLGESEWNALVQERNATMMTDENGMPLGGGFRDVADFTGNAVVQSILGDPAMFDAGELTVSSSYFLYFGETLVGEQVRRGKSLLFRNAGDVQVIRRTDANF